jgi:hypothetical protein
MTPDDEAARVAAIAEPMVSYILTRLTDSEKQAVMSGVTSSASQRNGLIEKSLVLSACRGEPKLPGKRRKFDAPPTVLGHAVRAYLLAQHEKNTARVREGNEG